MGNDSFAQSIVESHNKFVSEDVKVYGHGKKMCDVLNCYKAR